MRRVILPFALLLTVLTCKAQTIILSEDFQAGSPPTGWSKTQNSPSVGWEFGTSLGSSYFSIPAHTRYAASNDDKHDDNTTTANVADRDRLITPVMDLTPHSAPGVIMSFEYVQPGDYGSTGSIEVTTNGGTSWTSVATVATTTSWSTMLVDLSAYTSSSTVQVAFRHNDGGNWGDGFAIDDVVIKTKLATDGELTVINTDDFYATGTIPLSVDVTNLGSNPITSLDVNYSLNGGATVTDNITGLSIAFGATQTVNVLTNPNVATVQSNSLVMWISNVNGAGPDGNASNDTSSTTFTTLTSIPLKKAILEDHTGAWCGYCPDGTVISEQVANTYSNAIVVAVHNGDAMAIAEGSAIQSAYISGYPGGTVDHYKFSDESTVELNRGKWDSKMNERLGMVNPVAVSIINQSWNSSTREISFTVQADFTGDMSGDLRFNGYIVEDSVTGSGSGYDQTNYYNTTSGHPYQGAGNPIIGFVHDHVVRAMLGGAWGSTGVIPTSVTANDQYTKTYTYTLPATYKENHIKLVGLVQRYDADANNRPIYNAEVVALNPVTGMEEEAGLGFNGIYPNPFTHQTTIEVNLEQNAEVSVEIYDVYGKLVKVLAKGFMNSGSHSLVWTGDMNGGTGAAAGVYFVKISNGKAEQVEKVVLAK